MPQTQVIVNKPDNDVIDWNGQDPNQLVRTVFTGSSDVKPGMLLKEVGQLFYPATGSWEVNQGKFWALYKESPPSSQKTDFGSAYNKNVEIAAVPVGSPVYIKAFVGTITEIGVPIHDSGTGAGAVAEEVAAYTTGGTYFPHTVGMTVEEHSTGASGRAMIWAGH